MFRLTSCLAVLAVLPGRRQAVGDRKSSIGSWPSGREMGRLMTCVICFLCLFGDARGVEYSVRVVDLSASDLVYDPAGGAIWAGTAADGGSLTEVDPLAGSIGSSYAIGSTPGTMVISDDGSNIYAVVDGRRAVQRFNTTTLSPDLKFTMPGGTYYRAVKNICAIPGQPDSVVIARYYPQLSPPADGTYVYQDGVPLPDHFGWGAGMGGPDIITINETGDRVYGYRNTLSPGFPFYVLERDENGVHELYETGAMLSGFNVARIAVADGKLFTNRGEIKDLLTATSLGSFLGGGNFLLDPQAGKFYSVSPDSGQETVRVYDLDSLGLLGSIDLPGISGSTGSLVRFGNDGLAFRTSSQVVLLQSSLVPESSTFVLLSMGAVGLLAYAWRKRRWR